MVVVKVGIIVVFGLGLSALEFRQITAFPQASVFFRDVLLTIPFCFFSAVFIQVLNPMNIAGLVNGKRIKYWQPGLRCVPTELIISRSSR